MPFRENHPRTELLRYLEGETSDEEKRALEAHLASCNECRKYVSFVQNFNEGLGQLTKEEFASAESCPHPELLAAHEAGEVSEETARHLRAHLLYCDDCAEEFYALRRLSRSESWAEAWEKLKETVIDLARTYGPGALVGQIRISAEGPALVVRREGSLEVISKVLEVGVGENTYSIELCVMTEGSVSCNIAGYETPRSIPLMVSVLSESGEEVFATETDEHGNIRFLLEREVVAHDIFIFVLTLNGNVSYLPVQIPRKP